MVLNDAPSSSSPYRARESLEIMLAALISQTKGSAKDRVAASTRMR